MSLKTIIPIGAQALIPQALAKTQRSFIAPKVRKNGRVHIAERVHMPLATLEEYPYVDAVPVAPLPYEDGDGNVVELPPTLWRLRFGATADKVAFVIKVGRDGGVEIAEMVADHRDPPVEIVK